MPSHTTATTTHLFARARVRIDKREEEIPHQRVPTKEGRKKKGSKGEGTKKSALPPTSAGPPQRRDQHRKIE